MPIGFFLPAVATLTIEVPEYLSADAEAPVGHPLGPPLRTSQDADTWSIVNSPSGYQVMPASGSSSATIQLSAAQVLDFEASSTKEFATLTVRAVRTSGESSSQGTVDQPVVLKLVDAPVTSIVPQARLLSQYAHFHYPDLFNDDVLLGTSSSDKVLINGFERDAVYSVSDSFSGMELFEDSTGIWALSIPHQSFPYNQVLTLTVGSDEGGDSGTLDHEISVRLVSRPQLASVSQETNGDWVLVYDDLDCESTYIRVGINSGTETSGLCSDLVAATSDSNLAGASGLRLAETGGQVQLTLKGLPNSGDLKIGFYTIQCDVNFNPGLTADEVTACRAETAGKAQTALPTATYSLPFVFDPHVWPLVIGVEEYLSRDSIAPTGHVLGTLTARVDATSWTLVDSPAGFRIEAANPSNVATVRLAAPTEIDYEVNSEDALNRTFATLTVMVSDGTNSGQQLVQFQAVNGDITLLELEDAVLDTYALFASSSEHVIQAPRLRVNGEFVHRGEFIYTSRTGTGTSNIVYGGFRDYDLEIVAGAADTTDVTLDLDIYPEEDDSDDTHQYITKTDVNIQVVSRPVLDMVEEDSGDAVFTYSSLDCASTLLRVSVGDSAVLERCSTLAADSDVDIDGTALFNVDTMTTGKVKVVVSGLPDEAEVFVKPVTGQCTAANYGSDAAGLAACIADESGATGIAADSYSRFTIIDVEEYLSRDAEAPSGHDLGTVESSLDATSWSLVGSSSEYQVVAGNPSTVATIQLAAAKVLDFETTGGDYFATITVRAATSGDSEDLTVALRLTDADVTSTALEFEPLAQYIYFSGERSGRFTEIRLPEVIINGFSRLNDAQIIDNPDETERKIRLAGSFIGGDPHTSLNINSVPGEDLTLTIDFTSYEEGDSGDTIRRVIRIRHVAEPQFAGLSRSGSNWVLEYKADDCSFTVIRLQLGGASSLDEVCTLPTFGSTALGAATYEIKTDDLAGIMSITLGSLPSSGNLQVRFFTTYCDHVVGISNQLSCIQYSDSSIPIQLPVETFDLSALTTTPLIVGGANQVIRIPEADWQLQSGTAAGSVAAGYVVATVSRSPNFARSHTRRLNWRLVGSSADYRLVQVLRDSVHVVAKRQLVITPGSPPPPLTVRLFQDSDTSRSFDSKITFEVEASPAPDAVETGFQHIPDREVIAVAGDAQEFTVGGAVRSDAPNQPLSGEYGAGLIASDGKMLPLPHWISFDGPSRTFTVSPRANNFQGPPYKVRVYYLDRSVSPRQVHVSRDFSLYIRRRLEYAGVKPQGQRLELRINSGDDADRGVTDNFNIQTNGQTTSFSRDLYCNMPDSRGNVIEDGFATQTFTMDMAIYCSGTGMFIDVSLAGTYLALRGAITLNMEVTTGGVRQQLAVTIAIPVAAGFNNRGVGPNVKNRTVISTVDGTALAHGTELDAGTELITLTVAGVPATPNISFNVFLEDAGGYEDFLLVRRQGVPDTNTASTSSSSHSGDVLFVLRVRADTTLTLDHFRMGGDLQLGLRARTEIEAGSGGINLVDGYKQVILRVPPPAADLPHYIPAPGDQGLVRGQRHSFSMQAVDPEAQVYEQYESYTYSVQQVNFAPAPGWVHIDDSGRVEIGEAATAGLITLRVSAVNDADPPVAATSDVRLFVAEPLRLEGVVPGEERVTLIIFSDPVDWTDRCLNNILFFAQTGPLRSGPPCTARESYGTDSGVTLATYLSDSDSPGMYVGIDRNRVESSGKLRVTLSLYLGNQLATRSASGKSLQDIAAVIQALTITLDWPYVPDESFTDSADPQVVVVSDSDGTSTTHSGNNALSFAASHDFITLQVQGIAAGHEVSWSSSNTRTASADANIAAITVKALSGTRGRAAAIGFPSTASARVLDDTQYPFTLTVSAQVNPLYGISKQVVFQRSGMTLAPVLVVVNDGAKTFTRVPAMPTGAGTSYSAQFKGGSGSLRSLPGWLAIDSSSGQFTVDAHAPPGTYTLQVSATKSGTTASNIFVLRAVTPPRIVGSTAGSGTYAGIRVLIDMGITKIDSATFRYDYTNFGEVFTITCSPATSASIGSTFQGHIVQSCRYIEVRAVDDPDYTQDDLQIGAINEFGTTTLVISYDESLPTFVPDSVADFIVEQPAGTSIAAAGEKLATLTVTHTGAVALTLGNAGNDFEAVLAPGSPSSGAQTIHVQSKNFRGSLFTADRSELRLPLGVRDTTHGTKFHLVRNVIIRSPALRPQIDPASLPGLEVPYGEGRTFQLNPRPQNLPPIEGWQLMLADGSDADSDPDALPDGISFDAARLRVAVDRDAEPGAYDMVLIGSHGSETVQASFVLDRKPEPMRLARFALGNDNLPELQFSSWRGCVGDIEWFIRYPIQGFEHGIEASSKDGGAVVNTCTAPSYPSSRGIGFSSPFDIDSPALVFNSVTPVRVGAGLTLTLTVKFENSLGLPYTRVLNTAFVVSTGTVSFEAPKLASTVTVMIPEIPGTAAAVAAGTAAATLSFASDLGSSTTWRLAGASEVTGLLNIVAVPGSASRQALISWASAVTLDNESPDPPEIADMLFTVIQTDRDSGVSRLQPMRLLLANVEEASDDELVMYDGADTLIASQGSESTFVLDFSDADGDALGAPSLAVVGTALAATHYDFVPASPYDSVTLTLKASAPAGEYLLRVSPQNSGGKAGVASDITLLVVRARHDGSSPSFASDAATFSFSVNPACGKLTLDFSYGSEKIRYSVPRSACDTPASSGVAATKLTSQPTGFVSAFTATPAYDPRPRVNFSSAGRIKVRLAAMPRVSGAVSTTSETYAVSLAITRVGGDGSDFDVARLTSGSKGPYVNYAPPSFITNAAHNRISVAIDESNTPLAAGTILGTISLSAPHPDLDLSDSYAIRQGITTNKTRPSFILDYRKSTVAGKESSELVISIPTGETLDIDHERFPTQNNLYRWGIAEILNGSGPGKKFSNAIGFDLYINDVNEAPVLPAIPGTVQLVFSAAGDDQRVIALPTATDEDETDGTADDPLIYRHSGNVSRQSWISRSDSSPNLTLSAGNRQPGVYPFFVTAFDDDFTRSAARHFNVEIIEYLGEDSQHGHTITIEVAEPTGHNAQIANAADLGELVLNQSLPGSPAWSVIGSNAPFTVAAKSGAEASTGEVTAARALNADYESLAAGKVIGEFTLQVTGTGVKYQKVVKYVATDVDDSVAVPAVSAISFVQGKAGQTPTLPEATNPASVPVTYSVTGLPAYLSFAPATRVLTFDNSHSGATAGASGTFTYAAAETGNTSNSGSRQVSYQVVSPSTGTIVIDDAGLSALTRASTSTSISLELSTAPDSKNVTLTLTSSSLVTFTPNHLVFTPSNYSDAQEVVIGVGSASTYSDSTEAVTVAVHGASSSDLNYIFAAELSFDVRRNYVNRPPVVAASGLPAAIVLESPAAAVVIMTIAGSDPDGDAVTAGYDVSSSALDSHLALNTANGQVTLLANPPAFEGTITPKLTDAIGAVGTGSAIPLIIGSASFDASGHTRTSGGVASFTFSYQTCGKVVVDVGYGTQKKRYTLAKSACDTPVDGGSSLAALTTQPAGFVSAFTSGYDPAPVIDLETTAGKAVVRLSAFPIGEATGAYSVSLALVRTVGSSDVAHGRATSGDQASYTRYLAPTAVNTHIEVNESNAELAAGSVLGTLTLASGLTDVQWADATLDQTVFPTGMTVLLRAVSGSEDTEGELYLEDAFTLDYESLSGSKVYATRISNLTEGTGSDAMTAAAFAFEVRVIDVNEAPVLPAIPGQGPYAATGDTSVRTFQVPAAADEDVPADTITYAAKIKGSSGLPAGVTFNSASRTFSLAAGTRAAGDHTIEVIPTDSHSLAGDAAEFELRIVEYIAGLTTTIYMDEESGVGATRTGTVGTLTLSEALAAAAWTRVGTSSQFAVAAHATKGTTEGVISLIGSQPFDYEATTGGLLGRVTVQAAAGAVQYRQVLEIRLANVLEGPVFPAVIGKLRINERIGTAPFGSATNVGSPVAATDGDGDTIGYSMVGTSALFEVSSTASGAQVRAKATANLNHEATAEHVITLRAADLSQTADAKVTIEVVDVADTPIAYTSHGFDVDATGANVITMGWNNSEYNTQFAVSDRKQIVVRVVAPSASDNATRILAHTATGLTLSGLQPSSTYSLYLRWDTQDAMSAEIGPVTADTDAGMPVPTFGGNLAFDLAENSPVSTAVGTATATDADDTNTSDAYPAYAIKAGGDGAFFSIDAATGAIAVASLPAGGFDHESSKTQYLFLITATDVDGNVGETQVAVNVTNVDEPLTFPSARVQFSVLENRPGEQTAAGTVIGRVTAADPEGATPTYALTGTDSASFQISTDGDISPAAAIGFDQSSKASYTFMATASDGGATASTEVVVNVTALPDPVFASGTSADFSFSSSIGAADVAGTALATVSASVPGDAAAAIGYAVVGTGADAAEDVALFDIDVNGVIRLKADNTFDPSSKFEYAFQVRASAPEYGKSSLLAVRILLDRPAPQFARGGSVQFELEADPLLPTPAGTVIGTVAAAISGDETAAIAYSVVGTGTDAAEDVALFEVTAAGVLQLRVDRLLDADAKPEHSFRIQADAASYGSSGLINVVVRVSALDVDRPVPQFALGAAVQFELVVSTDSPTAAGREIGQVAAAVPGQPDERISYAVVGTGADADEDISLFRVAADGMLRLGIETSFDLEDKAEHSFQVQATSPSYGTSAVINVRVVLSSAETVEKQDMVVSTSADRAIAVAAADIIGTRIDAVAGSGSTAASGSQPGSLLPGGQERQLRLLSAEDMWAEWEHDEGIVERNRGIDGIRYMRLRQFMHDDGFDFALSGGASRGPQARVWGSGSRVNLEGTPMVAGERFSYEGEVDTLMFGVEARTPGRRGQRLGLAYSTSEADFSVASGKVVRSLQSVHPYLSFDVGEESSLWLSMGFGRGEYERGAEVRSASALSAAGGGSSSWQLDGYQVGASARFVSGRSVLARSAVFDEMTLKAWRAEVELEVGREFSYPDQELRLHPFASLNTRKDGGDGTSVGAFDAGGGVRLNWSAGLQVELSGRVQATNDDSKESRLEGSFSYDYANDGRGWTFSAQPHFERIEHDSGRVSFRRTLAGKVGYGLPVSLFSDSGLSRISVSASAGGSGEASASYGWNFSGRRLDVDLAAGGSDLRIDFKFGE